MKRIMSSIVCGFLVIGATQETGQKTENPSNANETTMFGTNRCIAKGGVGIVNKSLYIIVRSASNGRNELIVKPTQEEEVRWAGQSTAKAEIVVLYGGKVWSTESLPDRFDLSKAVVISFENDKVRFFDFQAMLGGYYERTAVRGSQ